MKIISMADIHGDFETFDKAMQYVTASEAEVLAITGDLSGRVFDDSEREAFARSVQPVANSFFGIRAATDGKVKTLHDAAEFISQSNVEAPDELKKDAEQYLKLEGLARERMLHNYQEFRGRFDDLKSLGKRVLLVPGNWDGKCLEQFLRHENISHKYFEEIAGIKFAGYGGSPKHPKELPEDLTVEFDDDELFSHLDGFKPEVVLTHVIPRGYESGSSFPGQYSLLAYLYKNAPSLMLTGDSHRGFILKEEQTTTTIANPGNLGRYEQNSYGTFLEFEIDKDSYVKPVAIHNAAKESVQTEEISPEVMQILQ